MDIIDFVRVWNGPKQYTYASMGGQFLEDFKSVYDRFGFEALVSVEQNEVTWKRQLFNLPLGFIDCQNKTSGEFVEQYESLIEQAEGTQVIVWLDFAEANNRGVQLQEYQSLVERLIPGDIVKVTLNANPQSKKQRYKYPSNEDFEVVAINSLRKELGNDYTPNEINSNDLKPKAFAKLLAGSIKTAALRGIEGASDNGILPLGSYRYSDGEHQMLTVTALVTNDELQEKLESDEAFLDWPLRSTAWDDVHNIRVPSLSQKERQFINERIGKKQPHEIHSEMPFWLEDEEHDSQALLRDYVAHYRRYPSFGRVYV